MSNVMKTKFIDKIKSNDVLPKGNEHVYQCLSNNPIINCHVTQFTKKLSTNIVFLTLLIVFVYFSPKLVRSGEVYFELKFLSTTPQLL